MSGTDLTSGWLSCCWEGQTARYAAGREPGLLPTCFAVLASELTGDLARWPTGRRQAVAAGIAAWQDADTGLFAPQTVIAEDLLAPRICDARYLRYQITYFALAALQALGEKPRFPLLFAKSYLDAQYLLGWLDGGPWHDPWNHSNRYMFVLRFLIHLAHHENDLVGLDVLDQVLADLLRRQSLLTGLWHGLHGCDLYAAVFAAYHFLPFFFWRGLCPPHADRMIDAVLSIQHSDGLFGRDAGGGACEDLDSIDVLVKLSLVTTHREKEILQALRRSYSALQNRRNPDGGFPNYPAPAPYGKTLKRRAMEALGLGKLLPAVRDRPAVPYHYSSWKRLSAHRGESDVWGTWFRQLAISLIESRLDEFANRECARFHRLPCLGWHDAEIVSRAAQA